jgi:hypothetical protein
MTQNGGHSLLAANDSQPESPVCIALLGITRGSPKYSIIRQNNSIIFIFIFIFILLFELNHFHSSLIINH